MAARRQGRGERGGEAGFTLVELLVAMTLLAFLSVALFGGLRFGARSWEAVVETSADRDRIASAQTFLRERLSQLSLPGHRRLRSAYAEGTVAGEPDRITFVAPWLSALALGGLYEFTVWHEGDGDGRLMLRWQPLDADPDALDALEDLAGERVLIDGVPEISLSYFGAAEGQDEPQWNERWEDPALPPSLVRLDLIFADPGRAWPDFVVALKY